MPAVLLLPLGAPVLSGRQDATRPERWHPGAQISAISDPFWAFSEEFVAPGGAYGRDRCLPDCHLAAKGGSGARGTRGKLPSMLM